jgi:hypothetical protein
MTRSVQRVRACTAANISNFTTDDASCVDRSFTAIGAAIAAGSGSTTRRAVRVAVVPPAAVANRASKLQVVTKERDVLQGRAIVAATNGSKMQLRRQRKAFDSVRAFILDAPRASGRIA